MFGVVFFVAGVGGLLQKLGECMCQTGGGNIILGIISSWKLNLVKLAQV